MVAPRSYLARTLVVYERFLLAVLCFCSNAKICLILACSCLWTEGIFFCFGLLKF